MPRVQFQKQDYARIPCEDYTRSIDVQLRLLGEMNQLA